jgi:hypothetical protein
MSSLSIGIRLQHGMLLGALARPFRLGPTAWWAFESQGLRLSPNGLVAAARELGLQLLQCRRGIILPEPRMVCFSPALLAPALTQGSLDPQMLFHI